MPGGGRAWQGGIWQGACMAGDIMHGRRVCMVGGGLCAWQGAFMAGRAGEMAIAAGGTHPTEMYSCIRSECSNME